MRLPFSLRSNCRPQPHDLAGDGPVVVPEVKVLRYVFAGAPLLAINDCALG